jgi:hypothetical protein
MPEVVKKEKSFWWIWIIVGFVVGLFIVLIWDYIKKPKTQVEKTQIAGGSLALIIMSILILFQNGGLPLTNYLPSWTMTYLNILFPLGSLAAGVKLFHG